MLDKGMEAAEQIPWAGAVLTLLKGFYSGVVAANSGLRDAAKKLAKEIEVLLVSTLSRLQDRAKDDGIQEAPDFLPDLQELLEEAVELAYKHTTREKGKKGRSKFIKDIILGPGEIEKMEGLSKQIRDLLELQGFVDQQKMVQQLGSVESKLDELLAQKGSPLKGSPKEKFHETKFDRELGTSIYPGTRSITLQKVADWMDGTKDESANQRMMVLCGEKYLGKTMLSSELCRRYTQTSQVAGYFFFQFRAHSHSQIKMFLLHLGYSFCQNIDGYADHLADVSDAVFDNTEDICKVIPLPFKELAEPASRMILIVDGIDQVASKNQPELIEFLASFSQNFPSWLNLFVTTRPVAHIVDNLNSSQENGVIFLEFSTEDTQADIKTYVAGMLQDKDKNDITQIQNEILKKVDDSFIYAYYAVNEVIESDIADSTESLSKLPKTMDDFHQSQFSKLKSKMGDNQPLYTQILGIMLAAEEPLDVSLILKLVGSSDTVILDLISSHIILKKDGHLMFYHHAAAEWLLKQSLDGLGGDVTGGHTRLSEWCCECLTAYLAFKTSKETPENDAYALKYALYHYLEAKEFGKLRRLLCDFGYIWFRITVDEDRHKNMMQMVDGYEKVLNNNTHDGLLEVQMYFNFILENAQALVHFPAHVLQYAANSQNTSLAKEAKAKLDDLSMLPSFKERTWLRMVLEPPSRNQAQVCRHFTDQVWALDLSADSSKVVLLTSSMSASAHVSVGCRLHVLDCRTGVDICRPISLDGLFNVPFSRKNYLQSYAQCTFLPGDDNIFFGSHLKLADCKGHLTESGLEIDDRYISYSCAVHHEKQIFALSLMDSTNPMDCVVKIFDFAKKTLVSTINTESLLSCSNFSSRGDRLLLHDHSNTLYLIEEDAIKELSSLPGSVVHAMFNKHDSVVILSSLNGVPTLAQFDSDENTKENIYEWSMKAPVSFSIHSHRMYVLHGNPDPSVSTSFRVSHFDLTKNELSGNTLLTINSSPCPTFINNVTGIEVQGDRLAHRVANTVSIYSLAKLHSDASDSHIDVEAMLELQAPNIIHRLSFLTPGDVVVQRIDGGVGQVAVDFAEVGNGKIRQGFKKTVGQITSSLLYSLPPASTEDGKLLLLDTGRDVGNAAGVFLWNHGTKEVTRLATTKDKSSNDPYVVDDMSFGPHENQILIGSRDGGDAFIDIFDATSGAWTKRLEGRGSFFLPCAKTGLVSSCDNDGKVYVWDKDYDIKEERDLLETGCLNRDELAPPIATSSDREKAVILQVDYEKIYFLLYNARTCRIKKVLEETEAAPYFIYPYPHLAAFSPDDTVVATAIMTAFVRIYDVFDKPGELLKIIGHGCQPITSGVWCSHRSLALVTERKNDAILRVWDCQSGNEVNYYPLKETVTDVLASPTRKNLVVGLKTSGAMVLHQENLTSCYEKTLKLLQ